jgi:tetratricopeptide (TPR) repeat protein
MDRRGFVTITGATLTGLAESWARAPHALASVLDGDRVTELVVGTLEQRVATLRALDDQMGGARLLDQARGDLALLSGVLRNGRYTEVVGRRLYGLVAQISHLTGWMAYDAGLRSASQQYYVGALRAARTAGDDGLGACLLAEMGVHASDAGQLRERVSLIETALEQAPTSMAPGLRSYLWLRLAESSSHVGEHGRAGSALNRAFDLWGRHRSAQDLPDWLGWFDEAQMRSTEGKVLLRAGQFERAVAAFEVSVSEGVPWDSAVRSGYLATARLVGRDLDGALDAASSGVALLEDQVTSDRALSRLKEFDGRLNGHGDEPAVRRFRERLFALPAAAA